MEGWFTDDTPKRFEAYGWNVIPGVDGHDVAAVDAAIARAKQSDRPTLICCKTIIGKGSPNLQGGDKVHGAALGEKEVAAVREHLIWDAIPFDIPAPIYEAWDQKQKGAAVEGAWNELFAGYRAQYPELAAEFERRMKGDLPDRKSVV